MNFVCWNICLRVQSCCVTCKFGSVSSKVIMFAHVRHRSRVPDGASMSAAVDGRDKVTARTREAIDFGDMRVDLTAVQQLVEHSQTRAIAEVLLYASARHMTDPGVTVRDLLRRIDSDLDEQGLDVLKPTWRLGNLSRPRPLEIAAALNRYRGLRVRQVDPE